MTRIIPTTTTTKKQKTTKKSNNNTKQKQNADTRRIAKMAESPNIHLFRLTYQLSR